MLDRLPDLDPAAIVGALNSVLMLSVFLAMLIPFSWRRRRSWVAWSIGLVIAMTVSGILGAGTLFLSALPAAGGDRAAIGAAADILLFKAGFIWILVAPLAPFVASLVLYATESFWSRAIRSAILRWGVVVIAVAGSAVAPAVGMIMTVGASPERGERLQGATSTPRFATSLGTEGAVRADRPALDLRGGVSD